MATLPLIQITPYKARENGFEFRNVAFTGTPVKGDVLVMINNVANIIGSDPSLVSHLMVTNSTNTIPGASTSRIDALQIKPGDRFLVSVYHGTAASAVLADADIDGQTRFGIKQVTVGGITAWALDLEEASTKVFTIIDRHPDDTGTDVYPRAIVEFIPSILQAQ